MYQPTLGRFLSRDPLPLGGPHILDAFPNMKTSLAPKLLGPYSYVSNNPINAVDPSGLDACLEICLAIVKRLKGKTCNELYRFCTHLRDHRGEGLGKKAAETCLLLADAVCLPGGPQQFTNQILRMACQRLFGR